MNRKLFKNIRKFYKEYDQEHLFDGNEVVFTKDDMYDYSALMSAYEAMWLTMDYEEVKQSDYYEWLENLYNELGDYIHDFTYGRPTSKVVTIIKLAVSIFGIMCMGAFIAGMIEYGCHLEIVGGLLLALILAVLSGIGVYEDIKECE